jgi:ATP-dependent DNA helicase RecG
MRRGEDLVAMSAEVLKQIFDEAQPDYSAETCPAATIADLNDAAIEKLRELWQASSGKSALTSTSTSREQLLEDAELTVDGKLTYAAEACRKLPGSHAALNARRFSYDI